MPDRATALLGRVMPPRGVFSLPCAGVDMPFDPKIAFGLRLTKVALAAKCGQLTNRDRINLMDDALTYFRHDDVVCDAVLAFIHDSQVDMAAAGAALGDFIEVYCGPDRFARMGATEAAHQACLYDWQRRVDING